MSRPPDHWIRPNETTRVPRDLIYIAVTTTQERKGNDTIHTFRAGAAIHDSVSDNARRTPRSETAQFVSAADLWATVDRWANRRGRTVVVAHDLSAMLRSADGFRHLPSLGWQITGLRFDRGHCWAQWRKGKRSLVMVDAQSWIPGSLARYWELAGRGVRPAGGVGGDVGQPEPEPVDDVATVAAVYRAILGWIERDDLGNWKPTGAGQAWAYWRHAHLTHRILAHSDDQLRSLERQAAYAGRGEAWRWGDLGRGRWDEWDTVSAYGRICRDGVVPTKPLGAVARWSERRQRSLPAGRCALVRATVATDVPVLPWRASDGILWPVGRFSGVWWSNELELALEHGARVEWGPATLYAAAPALRSWGEWLIDTVEGRNAGVGPIQLAAVKHWGRALIGRFGAQWTEWDDFGEPPTPTIGVTRCVDVNAANTYRLLSLGDRCQVETGVADGPDSAPSVMSYVMAETRVRLWRAMEVAGFDNLIHVDTDGMILNRKGSDNARRAALDGWRVKGQWTALHIHGSRRITGSVEKRLPGIPRNATDMGGGQYGGETTERLASALSNGRADRVRVMSRVWTLGSTERRRTLLPGGLTAAREVDDGTAVTVDAK